MNLIHLGSARVRVHAMQVLGNWEWIPFFISKSTSWYNEQCSCTSTAIIVYSSNWIIILLGASP